MAAPVVQFDSQATADIHVSATTTADLTTMTVGTQGNRGLIGIITFDVLTVSNVALTWDQGGLNQAMTLLGTQNSTGAVGRVDIFGLVNPTPGNKTLRATWTTNSEAFLSAASFYNVRQEGGAFSFPDVVFATGSTTSMSIIVPNRTNGATVAAVSVANTISSTDTQTQIFLDNAGVNTSGAASRGPGSASNTHSFTESSGVAWAMVGVSLAAVNPASFTVGAGALPLNYRRRFRRGHQGE